jgi:hypothetical protein
MRRWRPSSGVAKHFVRGVREGYREAREISHDRLTSVIVPWLESEPRLLGVHASERLNVAAHHCVGYAVHRLARL